MKALKSLCAPFKETSSVPKFFRRNDVVRDGYFSQGAGAFAPPKGSGYCTKLAAEDSKMEILAGLVNLDDDVHLPAPWFNRPSLGLLSNTAVSVGVLTSKRLTPKGTESAPPDIIVTPLDVGIMHSTVSVVVDFKERPGVVYKILSKIPRSFNIALAETVTVDQRTKHRVTLVLEYAAAVPTQKKVTSKSRQQLTPAKRHMIELKKLKNVIENIEGCSSFLPCPVIEKNTTFENQSTSIVDQGLIKCEIARTFLNSYRQKFEKEFNFDAVVVSSSADGRFIRYITPKKGTFEVTVLHKDTPGSLDQVTNALNTLKYNILLSRLSRSVANANHPGTSTYVAVCEPPKNGSPVSGSYAEDIQRQIQSVLNTKERRFQLSVKSVTLGTTPERVAFPYRTGLAPHIREFRAPVDFRSQIGEYTVSGRKKVFLSYQDPKNALGYGQTINSILYDEIKKAGMEVYDGFSMPDIVQFARDVHARMWIASAAFFVVRASIGKKSRSTASGLSAAQLYELGFIHGEGKPWFCICQAGHEESVSSFMNPQRSLITYDQLDNAAKIEEFRMKIRHSIGNWRLIPSSPRGR